MDDLTEAVIAAKARGKIDQELQERLDLIIYNYARFHLGRTNEDNPAEFLVFVRPKVCLFLRQFRFQGFQFESYLNTCLTYQRYLFYHKQNEENEIVFAAENLARENNTYTLDDRYHPSILFLIRKILKDFHVTNRSGQIRESLLTWVIKMGFYIDEDQIEEIASHLKCDSFWLHENIHIVKDYIEPHYVREKELKEDINHHFARWKTLHKRIRKSAEPIKRERWEKRAEKTKSTIQNKRRVRSGITFVFPNKRVAALLGITKFAVDSRIYRLRKELTSLYEANDFIRYFKDEVLMEHEEV